MSKRNVVLVAIFPNDPRDPQSEVDAQSLGAKLCRIVNDHTLHRAAIQVQEIEEPDDD